MGRPAIAVDSLGKQYRLGRREAYGTLRDTIAGLARQMRGRSKSRPSASSEELIWALRGVSFEVARGEVVGVIGANGAGKSTLLKLLSRITEPSVGRAEIWGRVGTLLEVGTGFHQELTGRENVYLNGAILGMRRREIAARFDDIVAFAGVERFLDTPVKHYSSGMQVRLAFAVAAHLEPEILLVDEVLAVGDAAYQRKSLARIGQIAREGRTILMVSHNMDLVEQYCPRSIVLREGELAFDGETHRAIKLYFETLPETGGGQVKRLQDSPVEELTLRSASGARLDNILWRTPEPLELTVEIRAAEPIPCPAVDIAFFREGGLKIFAVQTDRAARQAPAGSSQSWTVGVRIHCDDLAAQTLVADVGVRLERAWGYLMVWERACIVEILPAEARTALSVDSIVRPRVEVSQAAGLARS